MSSVRPVPETELMGGEELSADDAWHTVRRYHLGRLFVAAFLRFRYGDPLLADTDDDGIPDELDEESSGSAIASRP